MSDPKEYLTTNVAQDIFSISDKDICLARYPHLNLQVLKVRKIGVKDDEKAKVRFTLSDGTYTLQGVYTHNTSDSENPASQLAVGTVLKITNYEAFVMPPGKPVLLFENWEISHSAIGKLGSPTVLKMSESGGDDSTTAGQQQQTANNSNGNGNGNSSNNNNGSIIPKEEPKSAPKPASKPTSGSTKTSKAQVTPIEYLSPYANQWTIRARVTLKGDIKEFTSQKGIRGKLFNVNLLDESSEIRATGFTEAADKWFDYLQEGSVYYISKASVILANKRFSTLPNEYEIRFDRDTQIEKCDDEATAVPQMRYSFVGLNDLDSVESGANIDAIGVIKSVDDSQEITSKAGKTFEKRELHVVDNSKFGVNVTLWGNTAKEFNQEPGTVVALKGARVNDFNGKSLSVGFSTNMSFDPDIPESHNLKGWFDSGGKDEPFNTFKSNVTSGDNVLKSADVITIAKAKDDNLGQSGDDDFFNIKGTVNYIKSTQLSYPACITEGCKKKVVEETDGQYRCEKCNISMKEPKFLYLMSPVVEDHTGRFWLNCFDEVAEKIMGIPANELIQEGDDEKINKAIANALGYEYKFRVKARPDTYNDQGGVRYQAAGIAPLDFVAESAKLIELINKY